MGTVHCPLCGLRFRTGSGLDQHARDEHGPPLLAERRETIRVPRHRTAAERPLDQVMARRRP